ncbi:tyrosine-type recombinase/integrase [Pseudarthrobacter sp. CC4]|uniref:tyrosine-type recombinase/integrase n=1 Tax=Pseudarthrobacter sp. CC4 TaxID=3029190 RepID=UPI003B8B142F
MRVFYAVAIAAEEGPRVWAVVDDRFRLSDECRGYALWLAHSGRAVNTQKAYQLRLARFLSWCEQTDSFWKTLRFHRLAAYKAHLERQDAEGGRLSGRTVNAHLTAVMVFLRYAVAHGFGTDTLQATVKERQHGAAPLFLAGTGKTPPPARLLKAREIHRRPVVLSPSQAERVLGAVERPRDRLLILLMLRCGLRAGEALGLRLEDMHMLPDSGHVGCIIPGPHVHIERRSNPNGAWAKSPYERNVPAPADVCEVHAAYMAQRYSSLGHHQPDAVFLSTAGKNPAPLGYSGLHSMLTAIGKATNLPVKAHQFRHTAATCWARAKVDPDVIMALLGHRSLASTSIYLHPAQEELRNAVDSTMPSREAPQ